ncbi:MAG: radical SAM protein [Magnetococcus sp. WYHC-3]
MMSLRLFLSRTLPLILLMLRRRRVTPRKLVNLARNFYLGRIRQSAVRGPVPSVMMVEVSNACNLKCTGCALQWDEGVSIIPPRKMINLDAYRSLIDEVGKDLLLLAPYLGGESFLHPEILTLIKYAADRGITVSVATNGSFDHIEDFGRKVAETGLDLLIFSISGTSQEVYERFHRRGRLDRVVANIRDVTRLPARSRPRVAVRYLATPENLHDLANLPGFAREVGADYHEIRMVDGKLEAVSNVSDLPGFTPSPVMGKTCFWLNASSVVKANLEVIPCCYDYYGVPEVGRLGPSVTMADVWNGPGYRRFRDMWRQGGSGLDCCINCRPSAGFQDIASENSDVILVRRQRLALDIVPESPVAFPATRTGAPTASRAEERDGGMS